MFNLESLPYSLGSVSLMLKVTPAENINISFNRAATYVPKMSWFEADFKGEVEEIAGQIFHYLSSYHLTEADPEMESIYQDACVEFNEMVNIPYDELVELLEVKLEEANDSASGSGVFKRRVKRDNLCKLELEIEVRTSKFLFVEDQDLLMAFLPRPNYRAQIFDIDWIELDYQHMKRDGYFKSVASALKDCKAGNYCLIRIRNSTWNKASLKALAYNPAFEQADGFVLCDDNRVFEHKYMPRLHEQLVHAPGRVNDQTQASEALRNGYNQDPEV